MIIYRVYYSVVCIPDVSTCDALSKKQRHYTVYVIVALGVVAIIAIIVVVGVMAMKKRKRNSYQHME